MYRYDEFDLAFVKERAQQFRGQVARRLSGGLSEDEFKPLRLQNGVYLQLHAYMLRVAVPYGTLSGRQMRMLAHIARKYDKGYGHFTTRQNIQYNWPKLEDVPDILDELAGAEMHAIQTSGNCIRNVTADHYAGAAADEIEDSRVTAEIVRQWSTLHPEFAFLPRKFKIAVTASPRDRAAVRFHDIGLALVKNAGGETGFEVWAGGGQGRTPMIARRIRGFLPRRNLLSYLEAVLRVYNMLGRRDNKYKARIKILIHETGAEEFTRLVEKEWRAAGQDSADLPEHERARIAAYFAPPPFEALEDGPGALAAARASDAAFAAWEKQNTAAHRAPGYAIVNISLKPAGGVPGDATSAQMEAAAELAEKFSFDEIRVTHEQNLTLPHVRQKDLPAVFKALGAAGLAESNIGQVTDIICCPGLDYCSLANARSIPVAQRITERFAAAARRRDIGELKIKISGCINACGHHHAGHIGILGVDRRGEEFYQITLGGDAGENTAIGTVTGPAFSEQEIPGAVETVVETYVKMRKADETFMDTWRRTGMAPFKEALYGGAS